MDRQIIYPGQIPLDTDLLNTNKFTMTAIAKLVAGVLGTQQIVNGLAVTQTTVPSMNVTVAPGEIYSSANIDSTTYGSLAADSTHQVMKQGIMLDAVNLSCQAPGTVGFSINYLIQAAFNETDTGSVALPYYNASNPSMAWSGPANSGTPQATLRQDQCVVTVKAGASAATGTQATPAPDAGNVGLAVVTVAYGAANIVNANISQYVGASLVPQSGLASNTSHAIYSKSVAGNSDVTLTAQEAAYPILTLTGALTGNINLIVPANSRQRIVNNATSGAYQITVKTAAGTGVALAQSKADHLYCDGVNVLRGIDAPTNAQFIAGTVPVGTIIDLSGTSAPAGYLVCPVSSTNISRTTYAALFAAIGTTWGAGDGSTTFGMPWFAADYASVQANANVGTNSAGAVISHGHSYNKFNNAGVTAAGASMCTGDAAPISTGSGIINATGGAANLAAGVRVLKCVKY